MSNARQQLGSPLLPAGWESGRTEIDLEREPGFGWRLSDEALAEINEWERVNALALARLLARGVLIGSRDV